MDQEFYDKLHRHHRLADKVAGIVGEYKEKCDEVTTLERWLGPEDEKLGFAMGGLDNTLTGATARIASTLWKKHFSGKLADSSVLAASPAFAGPGTRPYRIALLQLADKGFSVHRLYIDEIGGLDHGSYFKEDGYALAMQNWLNRTGHEIEERGEACWHFQPIF